jgi:hypothetical protein
MPLTNDEKATIAGAVRGQFPGIALPVECSAWLMEYVPQFLAGTPPERPRPPTEAEVAAMALATLYGPAGAGPPDGSLLATMIVASRLSTGITQRNFEQALVFWLRPPFPASWDPMNTRAAEVLLHLVRRKCFPAIRWIGSVVLGKEDPALHRWAWEEADACAALIRGALIRGCHCSERWQDFHIENELLAVHHCATGHDLGFWIWTADPLDDFLFGAVVKGDLRSDGDAFANDFRRGMLAKIVADAELVAGPVLCCSQPGCTGEIQPDDWCNNRNCPSGVIQQIERPQVRKPTWKLWLKNHRGPVPSRRCKACDCLYFQWNGECPRGHQSWSRRETEVWMPTATVALLALPVQPLARDPDPITNQEILARVKSWPEEDLRGIGLRKFEHHVPLDECAHERGINPRSRRFKAHVITMYHRLADLLEDNEDKP